MNIYQVNKRDTINPVVENNDALVIKVPKSLTAIEALSFRQAFKPICESKIPPVKVILDFSRTSFLDSSGIGALASIIKTSKIADINLMITGVTSQVYSVLKMTKLDQLLSIQTSWDINSETATKVSCDSFQSAALVS